MTSENTTNTLAEIKSNYEVSSPARDRLEYFFDEGSFTELDIFVNTGEEKSGVITAFGYVEGSPAYAFSQDSTVKNGGMTSAQSLKIKKVLDLATKTGVPVVGIYDSYGADISNNISALSSYGELMLSLNNISGVVPLISVIAGTCAGTAAMLAVSADFVVISKDASFFVTPNTNKEDYIKNAIQNGLASIVCDDDKSSVISARKLLSKLPVNNLSAPPIFEFEDSNKAVTSNTAEIIEAISDSDSVIELYNGYGQASKTVISTIAGQVVGIIAAGIDSAKLGADDSSKIARFVRTCDAFAIPVVTLIDTVGFENTESSEKTGSIKSMVTVSHAYAEATTAKISVIVGKAYGPAYIALAGKGSGVDLVYANENAVISVVDPETAVEFLHHDKLVGAENLETTRKEVAKEYINENASAYVAAQNGCVDNIINLDDIRNTLFIALDILSGKRVSKLPKKHSNMPL